MSAPAEVAASKAVRWSLLMPLFAFVAVSIVTATPILMHAVLPSVDLPNHIARYAIMANPDGPLGRYYSVPAQSAVPNSAVDLLWRLSGMKGDPIRFANAIFAIYAVNFVASVMVLSRVLLSRWTVWPAVSGFLVYNSGFFWGFQNYLFSVPFALYGFALWLGNERRSMTFRLAIFLPFAAGLYLMHLFAFGVLAILAFGREVQKVIEGGRSWRPHLVAGLPSSIPFILPLAWMFTGSISEQGEQTDFGGFNGRLQALLSPGGSSALGDAPVLHVVGLIGFVLLVFCLLTLWVRKGPRLVADRRVWGAFTALLVVSALAPMWMNGVAFVHIRFPFVVVALLIAGSSWHNLSPRLGIGLAVVFAAIIGLRAALFEQYAAANERDIADLGTVLEDLPLGSRVLPLRATGHEMMPRLWQAQAYAVTLRQSFVPTLFQGVQALRVRPEWKKYSHPALYGIDIDRILAAPENRPDEAGYFWKDWEHGFTHALVVDPFSSDLIVGQPLRSIAHAGRFTLLEIVQ